MLPFQTEAQLQDAFDQMLNEIYGDFMQSYAASHILKHIDPIAYQCWYNDYIDTLCRDDMIADNLIRELGLR